GKLVVLDATFSVRQVLAFTAQINTFHDPTAGEFPLEIGVPLLDYRIAPIDEEALTDAKTQVGACAAGGAFLRTLRQIETIGKRIAESSQNVRVVRGNDHARAALESFGPRTPGCSGRLQYGRPVHQRVRAAEHGLGSELVSEAEAR